MTDITIPREARIAAAKKLYILNLTALGHPHPEEAWDALPSESKANVEAHVEAACLATLKAWPGAFQTTTQINRDATEVLILPLPTEKLE